MSKLQEFINANLTEIYKYAQYSEEVLTQLKQECKNAKTKELQIAYYQEPNGDTSSRSKLVQYIICTNVTCNNKITSEILDDLFMREDIDFTTQLQLAPEKPYESIYADCVDMGYFDIAKRIINHKTFDPNSKTYTNLDVYYGIPAELTPLEYLVYKKYSSPGAEQLVDLLIQKGSKITPFLTSKIPSLLQYTNKTALAIGETLKNACDCQIFSSENAKSSTQKSEQIPFEQKLAEVKEIVDNGIGKTSAEVRNSLDNWISINDLNLLTGEVAILNGEGFTKHAFSLQDIQALLLNRVDPECPYNRKKFTEENLFRFNTLESPEYQAAINEAYNIIHPEEDGNVKVAGGSAFAGSDSV